MLNPPGCVEGVDMAGTRDSELPVILARSWDDY
jgi:hypothetical protein